MSLSTVKLGELMPRRGKSVDPAKFPEEEFALFSVPAYDSQLPDRVLGKQIGSTKQVVQPGDVLLSKIVPHIRRAWIVPNADERRQIGSSEWIIFRSPRFFGPYLRHVLLSDQFNAQLMQTVSGVGGSLLRARPSGVAELRIALPPIEEQRRIAAILDQAEELRSKRRAAIALLDQLPQSIFLETFGDPITNPKDWPIRKLSELGTLDRGVSKHRPRNAPELLGGVHPLIQTGDVANSDGYIRKHTLTYSDLGLAQSKKWPAGTLCITIAANIAKTGILTFDACFPDSVVAFTPQKTESTQYVRVWLSFLQKTLEDSAPESAQKNINLEILNNLPVPVPPAGLQLDFNGRVNAIYHTKALQTSSLEELDDLGSSLQTEILGGEL